MSSPRAPRNTLTRERLLHGALELADRRGLDKLTIRALAEHLGVKPMAIYHYIRGKEELLDAMVDAVFAAIELPDARGDWRAELDTRSRSLRAQLTEHPWALAVLETRANPGPANLAGHDAVLETLRSAGFSVVAAGHAYAMLDAFVYGFALQEVMLARVGLEDDAEELMGAMDFSTVPRMAELAAHYAEAEDYPLRASFDLGLELLLDALERLRVGG